MAVPFQKNPFRFRFASVRVRFGPQPPVPVRFAAFLELWKRRVPVNQLVGDLQTTNQLVGGLQTTNQLVGGLQITNQLVYWNSAFP